jgi:hypothetical protein
MTGTMRHVKTLRLKRRLGNAEDFIVCGILNMLWDMTAEQAPHGDIGRFTNEDVAAYLGWTGDCDELVEALTNSGWLDRCSRNRLVVHDWHVHAPKYIKDRLRKSGQRFATLNKEAEKPLNKENGASPTLDSPETERHRRSEVAESSVTDAEGSGKSHINGTERNATERNATQPRQEAAAVSLPVKELVDLWNAGQLTKCTRMTDKRRKALKTRMDDAHWRTIWKDAIAKCHASAFCCGSTGWVANIEWFFKPDSAINLMEGKYDGNRSAANSSSSQASGRVQDAGNRQEPEVFDEDNVPF